jgi:ABC-type multidrug transport system ATPase subunit
LLLSTHNPSEAARLAKRCLVLSNGRLVHDGEVPAEERLSRMMEVTP